MMMDSETRVLRQPIGLLALLLIALACVGPRWVMAQHTRILVQDSPLAGFRHHAGKHVWEGLRLGDRLDLVREPGNQHDARAIRIEWNGAMLGYVPRAENTTLAWALDRGEPLRARISRLVPHANPRARVRFEVFVDIAPPPLVDAQRPIGVSSP